MKILFLNFSDHNTLGQKSCVALTKKYGEGNVTLVNLMVEALAWRNRNLNSISEQFRINLKSYDQIIIGTHSNKKNLNYCYCEIQPMQFVQLFSYQELAIFLKHYFIVCDLPLDKTLELVLSICYGGRIDQFEVDHISNADTIDFKNTFAYRFLDSFHSTTPKLEFTINPHVILRAYIGEVSFHSDTGELVVETESQIKLLKEIDKIDASVDAILQQLDDAKDAHLPDIHLWEQYDQLISQKADLLTKRLDLRAHYGELIYLSNPNKIINNTVDIYIDTSRLHHDKFSLSIQQMNTDSPPRRSACTRFKNCTLM